MVDDRRLPARHTGWRRDDPAPASQGSPAGGCRPVRARVRARVCARCTGRADDGAAAQAGQQGPGPGRQPAGGAPACGRPRRRPWLQGDGPAPGRAGHPCGARRPPVQGSQDFRLGIRGGARRAPPDRVRERLAAAPAPGPRRRQPHAGRHRRLQYQAHHQPQGRDRRRAARHAGRRRQRGGADRRTADLSDDARRTRARRRGQARVRAERGRPGRDGRSLRAGLAGAAAHAQR